jgi:hypothetical protein
MARAHASVEVDPFSEWEHTNHAHQADLSGEPTELVSALESSTGRFAGSSLQTSTTRLVSTSPSPGYSGEAFDRRVEQRWPRLVVVVGLAAMAITLAAVALTYARAAPVASATTQPAVPVLRPLAPPEVKTLEADADLEPLTPLQAAEPSVKPATPRR